MHLIDDRQIREETLIREMSVALSNEGITLEAIRNIRKIVNPDIVIGTQTENDDFRWLVQNFPKIRNESLESYAKRIKEGLFSNSLTVV